jgi:leader peptidase (prepilin peptidase)/N-methyltransferase
VLRLLAGWWADSGGEGTGALAALLGGLSVLAALAVGARLGWSDAVGHRLPRRWVAALYPLAVAPAAAAFLLAGRPEALLGGLAGALLHAAVPLLARRLSPGAVGRGDLRLAPALGALLGLLSVAHAAAGLLLTSLLGGLWAVLLVLTGRAGPGDRLALGPWMLLGATAVWLAAPARLL